MIHRVSSFRTWNKKPHCDLAVSVGVGGLAPVRPGILRPNSTDLQRRVGQQLHPARSGVDGAASSMPRQVVTHAAVHLTRQHGHASHGGSHVHCGPQDRRRLCVDGNQNIKAELSAVDKQSRNSLPFRANVCAGMLNIWEML